MYRIQARELLKLHRLQVQDAIAHLERKFEIEFDDGVVLVTTKNKLVYSSYFWDYHRHYPNTPLLSTHHVDHVLKGKYPGDKTHRLLLKIVYHDVLRAYNITRPEDREPLTKMIYQITNNIHNEITKESEPYVESGDILDFKGIVRHPVIRNIIENTDPNSDAITEAYNVALNVIRTDPSLDNNNVAKAVRAGTVNANQVMQCVAVRGFPAEVDGAILPTPIMSNYTLGMIRLYDLAAESRSAAKALYFSEAPLQDSEYFARRLQLLTSTVESIHYGDCGSTDYIHWRLNGPTYNEEGGVVHPGDLQFMHGKHYLDETTGQLKTITGDETNLYGTVIKIRSPMMCRHPNKHHICSTCFGALADNISRHTNIGMLCSGTMTKKTTQSVLSTKHLDSSSRSVMIVLTEMMQQYFNVDRKTNGYLVRPEFKEKCVRLTVSRDELFGLTDITTEPDINNINPSRISSVEYMDFSFLHRGAESSVPMQVNQGNRRAVITHDLIAYLKNHQWGTDARGNFVIDLSKFDFTKPIFRIPDVEYSYADHSHQIAQVIESSMKNIADRVNPHSPVNTLQELFMLTNSKLHVNLVALEVIIYANMIKDKDSVDMARGSSAPVLGVSDNLLFNRSLGIAIGYERQSQRLLDPKSFVIGDRPDSIFDVLIDPAGVLSRYPR